MALRRFLVMRKRFEAGKPRQLEGPAERLVELAVRIWCSRRRLLVLRAAMAGGTRSQGGLLASRASPFRSTLIPALL